MNEVQHILRQYNETMLGEAWYGDPVWKILEGIDAQCAAARILPEAHTIWQLVMHMAFWEDVGIRRFAGPVSPEEEEAGNFPNTPAPDEHAWQQTLQRFRASNDAFRAALSRLDPAMLDQNTPGRQKTFRWEAVGVIQHHIYHIGQVAILKKAFHARR